MNAATSRTSRRAFPGWLRLVLGLGVVLAVGSTVLVVVAADKAAWLRLAALAALWSALFAAFAMAWSRREARTAELRQAESRRTYELELTREIAARREFEVKVAEIAREDADSRHRDELAGLREQLDRLTSTLSSLLDGDVLVERRTLTAESTRVRQLSDAARRMATGPALPGHQAFHPFPPGAAIPAMLQAIPAGPFLSAVRPAPAEDDTIAIPVTGPQSVVPPAPDVPAGADVPDEPATTADSPRTPESMEATASQSISQPEPKAHSEPMPDVTPTVTAVPMPAPELDVPVVESNGTDSASEDGPDVERDPAASEQNSTEPELAEPEVAELEPAETESAEPDAGAEQPEHPAFTDTETVDSAPPESATAEPDSIPNASEEPVFGEPVFGELVSEEPGSEERDLGETASEEPASEGPVSEEPASEEPESRVPESGATESADAPSGTTDPAEPGSGDAAEQESAGSRGTHQAPLEEPHPDEDRVTDRPNPDAKPSDAAVDSEPPAAPAPAASADSEPVPVGAAAEPNAGDSRRSHESGGLSVSDLLAAYGSGPAPSRHRRRADDE